MKKLVITLAVLVIGYSAIAQTSFGIKVGPDFSSYAAKGDYYKGKETGKLMVGLSGGLYANLPIAPRLYIQPSLTYEGKGGEEKEYGTKTRLNYLTLPIDLLFKSEMSGASGSWFVGLGPYIGYGLSGKVTLSPNDSTSFFAYPYNKYPFSRVAFQTRLNRFDAGADVQLGYEMAIGFNVSLHGELGLLNALNDRSNDKSVRNTSFSVLVGYSFGKD